MKRLQRCAVILSLIEELLERDSWCGETHIQKATYFLQELLHVPLNFNFILYKHGPFSFDLSDELMAMRADEIVELKPRPPYGPSIIPSFNSSRINKLFPKTIKKYKKAVEFIADELSSFGVSELERIATALFVAPDVSELEKDEVEKRANRIIELKPHISIEQARKSLEERTEISNKAKQKHLLQTT